MHAMTLPEIRDSVRRLLGRPTASDTGRGPVGEPGNIPVPTNLHINAVVEEVLGDVDVFVRLEPVLVTSISVTAEPSTWRGAVSISLADSHWSPLPGTGGVQSIEDAQWTDSTGSFSQPLAVTTREELEVDFSDYVNDSPSTPLRAWIDRGALWVYPAYSVNGTIQITGRQGVTDFTGDVLPLTAIPPSLQPGFCRMVALQIAISQSGDADMVERKADLLPQASVARQRIQMWAARQNRGQRGGFRAMKYTRSR